MTGRQYFLEADPVEGLPDGGPRQRGGCALGLAMFLLGSITIGLICGLIFDPNSRTEFWLWATLIVLGGLDLAMLFVLVQNLRYKPAIAAVDVMRDTLKFHIEQEHRSLAITAFLRPDRLQQGSVSAFFLFAQNYSSRLKHVTIVLPRAYTLGSLSERELALAIKPGQAVVYRESFQVPPDAAVSRQVGISCKLKIIMPNGEGARLIPRRKRSQLVLMRSARLVFPMEITDGVDPAFRAEPQLPPPVYLSIFSPPMSEPRYELLRVLTHSNPSDTVAQQV